MLTNQILRVLLVDNQVLFREGLISMFKDVQDIEIVGEAGTEREAIEKAIKLKPDVILMEITMPDGDGPKLTREILYQLPQTKIVMLTNYDSFDMMITALLSGARGYLLKNTPIMHVLASLRAVIRGELALPRSSLPPILDELIRLERTNSRQYPEDRDTSSGLTPREIEVLKLLAKNAGNQDIARHLFITENTVKVHVSRILGKLNCKTRSEAGEFARRRGLGCLP